MTKTVHVAECLEFEYSLLSDFENLIESSDETGAEKKPLVKSTQQPRSTLQSHCARVADWAMGLKRYPKLLPKFIKDFSISDTRYESRPQKRERFYEHARERIQGWHNFRHRSHSRSAFPLFIDAIDAASDVRRTLLEACLFPVPLL